MHLVVSIEANCLMSVFARLTDRGEILTAAHVLRPQSEAAGPPEREILLRTIVIGPVSRSMFSATAAFPTRLSETAPPDVLAGYQGSPPIMIP